MQSSDKKLRHSYIIDYIRAFSAILIVLYHYTYRYNENAYIIATNSTTNWPFKVDWGYGAVVTFFMLSGYLLAKNISKNENSWIHFGGKVLVNRLFRLYPTYWVSMTLTALIIFFIFPEARISFKEYIVNLTMMASMFNVRFIDGAYWTLGYEVKFAIILSLILLFKRVAFRYIVLMVWIILSHISSYWADNSSILCKIVRVFLITDWIQTFVAGICIYQITIIGRKKAYYILLWIFCLVNQIFWIKNTPSLIFFITTSLLLYYIVYLDSILNKSVFTSFVEFIASISYPLYLIHQMVGFGIIKNLVDNGRTNELWLWIPFIISVVISYFIHKYIETPSSKGVFNFYPKIKI